MTTVPLPGSEVRGSRSGRPIMALLDLIGRRWSLRIIWELRAEPANFRALQARCDALSPTVLNTRLRELRGAGILEHGTAGYQLTERGKALILAMAPLHDWADGWEAALTSDTGVPE